MRRRLLLLLCLVLPGLLTSATPPTPGTYTVTLNSDSDPAVPNTLRAGIEASNSSNTKTNTINFTLPLNSTILLVDALPNVNRPLVIDGTSITGLGVAKLVPSATFDMLHVGASTTTLKDIDFSGGGLVVDAGAVLAFNYSLDVTISDPITGAGAINNLGIAVVTLSGANTWSGDTTIQTGTLSGSVASLPGKFTVNSGALLGFTAFDVGLAPQTFTGTVTGDGGIIKNGGHDLTLNGSLSYTGGTQVVDGRLIVDPATFVSSTNLNTPGILQLNSNSTSTVVFAQTVSGTGSLEKAGTAVVQLTGSNTYTGGTSVLGGALLGTTTTLQGNFSLATGTQLQITQSTAGIFNGIISGLGSVVLSGSGTVTFNTAHLYTGGTLLNGGTLILSSSLPGNITTAAGTTLQGPGGIAGSLNASGLIQPSPVFGSLAVGGAATFQSSSTLAVNVDSTGNHSRITVGGLTTINGATVNISPASGDYTTPVTYDILVATGGFDPINNSFNSTTTPAFAFLTTTVQTLPIPGVVRLTLTGVTPNLEPYATNSNQRATAQAFTDLLGGTDPDIKTVSDSLSVLLAKQVPDVLDMVGGETLGGLMHPRLVATERIARSIAQRFSMCRPRNPAAACHSSGRNGFWFEGIGGWDRLDGHEEALDLHSNFYGAAAGIDRLVIGTCDPCGHSLRLGLAGTYTHLRSHLGEDLGHLKSNGVLGSAYTSYQYCWFYLGVVGSYGYDFMGTERHIKFGGISRKAVATPRGQTYAGHAEGGARIPLASWCFVQPALSYDNVHCHQSSFREERAKSLELAIDKLKAESSLLSTRTSLFFPVSRFDGYSVEPEVYGGFSWELAEKRPKITGRFIEAPAGTGSFVVHGPAFPRDAVLFGGSFRHSYDGAPIFILSYDGTYSDHTWQHSGVFTVNLTW